MNFPDTGNGSVSSGEVMGSRTRGNMRETSSKKDAQAMESRGSRTIDFVHTF